MNLVVVILIGLAVGIMVELLLPGHTPGELVLAMFLGVAGALLAHYVGQWGGWFEIEDSASFVAAALGAIVLLLLYGALFRRRSRRR